MNKKGVMRGMIKRLLKWLKKGKPGVCHKNDSAGKRFCIWKMTWRF